MPPPDDQRPQEPRPTAVLPPPPRPSATRVPSLPAEPANQQRAVAALLVALLSLAGLLGLNDLSRGIYLAWFALTAGVVALFLSLTAISRSRRGRTRLPRGSVTAAVIAGVGMILSTAMLITFAVFGQQLSSYGRCLSGASTISAQQSCQNQFTHAVSRKVAVLRSAGKA